MNTLIRCIQIVYGIVETAEIEQIEEIKKQQEKNGYLGYRFPLENRHLVFYLKLPQCNSHNIRVLLVLFRRINDISRWVTPGSTPCHPIPPFFPLCQVT